MLLKLGGDHLDFIFVLNALVQAKFIAIESNVKFFLIIHKIIWVTNTKLMDGGNPVYPQKPYAEQFSEKLYLPA